MIRITGFRVTPIPERHIQAVTVFTSAGHLDLEFSDAPGAISVELVHTPDGETEFWCWASDDSGINHLVSKNRIIMTPTPIAHSE